MQFATGIKGTVAQDFHPSVNGFCNVVYNSPEFNSFNNFTFWSIIVVIRDVNLIFSFFHVYAVISKLLDWSVWNLAKNDVFTYQVFGKRVQNEKLKM
jgi:hypothetical protein